MLTLEKKDLLIRLYLKGLSYTAIAKEIGMTRQTVSKYVKAYELNQQALERATSTAEKEQIIIQSSAKPKYDASRRQRIKLTPEVDISYRSVCVYVAKQMNHSKEAFIRQAYDPGQVAEFDWGDVTLFIEELGAERRFKIGVFDLKYSDKRFAYLYSHENTEAFLDIHARFF